MKISNTMKIKTGENSFEDVKISYIAPNSCTKEGIDTITQGIASHAEGVGQKFTCLVNTFVGADMCSIDEASSLPFNGKGLTSCVIEYKNNFVKIVDANVNDMDELVLTLSSPLIWDEEENGSSNLECNIYINGALNDASHSEGKYTTARGFAAHTEGINTLSEGDCCHAEGINTIAGKTDTYAAHAEGEETIAIGIASHAEGLGTIATSNYQHVQGKYNLEEGFDNYAHIIGNGDFNIETGEIERSNAYALDWSGNGLYQGDVIAYAFHETEDEKISLLGVKKQLTALANEITVLANEVSALAGEVKKLKAFHQ